MSGCKETSVLLNKVHDSRLYEAAVSYWLVNFPLAH